MLDLMFWSAMLLSGVGALARSRASFALLASSLICTALYYSPVHFWWFVWFLIDFAAIALIIRRDINLPDKIILGLFLPAWVAYFLPDPIPYFATSIIVIAQMLIAFPARTVWRRVKYALKNDVTNDFFDKVKVDA